MFRQMVCRRGRCPHRPAAVPGYRAGRVWCPPPEWVLGPPPLRKGTPENAGGWGHPPLRRPRGIAGAHCAPLRRGRAGGERQAGLGPAPTQIRGPGGQPQGLPPHDRPAGVENRTIKYIFWKLSVTMPGWLRRQTTRPASLERRALRRFMTKLPVISPSP